ncbi:hypothetical protein [Aeromonas veronii]|uniref:hypothetical protein n=1 Tax=Aeromonas veronii TaxID=654 RepID=UPI0022453E36|nr:hypothetical protein [Aeromonas veronii]MCX0434557.1 BREX-1 system adenine-specific DNA-methyltransferase PglX [Aeromonas veronii]
MANPQTQLGGEVVSTTAFVRAQPHQPTYPGAYFRLVDGNSEAEKATMFKAANATKNKYHKASA